MINTFSDLSECLGYKWDRQPRLFRARNGLYILGYMEFLSTSTTNGKFSLALEVRPGIDLPLTFLEKVLSSWIIT